MRTQLLRDSRRVATVTATTDLTDAMLAINATTVSTGPTTGALTVAGGLGVSGAVHIGGDLFVAGNTTSVNSTNVL